MQSILSRNDLSYLCFLEAQRVSSEPWGVCILHVCLGLLVFWYIPVSQYHQGTHSTLMTTASSGTLKYNKDWLSLSPYVQGRQPFHLDLILQVWTLKSPQPVSISLWVNHSFDPPLLSFQAKTHRWNGVRSHRQEEALSALTSPHN